jgi:hypothetical protein
VDVTPLKKTQSSYGERETFRLVFESTQIRQNGSPYLLFSRGFTPSLHEKAALRGFIKQWFGRDLTPAELAEFDTETLIGRIAHLVIVHNDGRNGETYANIGLIRPDKAGSKLAPSGKYVRVKDRQDKDATYNRVSQPASESPQAADTWRLVTVHVGKHKGIELCDLDIEAVRNLYENWLPIGKALDKPLKADRDLMEGLVKAAAELGFEQPEADEIPY